MSSDFVVCMFVSMGSVWHCRYQACWEVMQKSHNTIGAICHKMGHKYFCRVSGLKDPLLGPTGPYFYWIKFKPGRNFNYHNYQTIQYWLHRTSTLHNKAIFQPKMSLIAVSAKLFSKPVNWNLPPHFQKKIYHFYMYSPSLFTNLCSLQVSSLSNACWEPIFQLLLTPREDMEHFPQCIASNEIFCTGGHVWWNMPKMQGWNKFC